MPELLPEDLVRPALVNGPGSLIDPGHGDVEEPGPGFEVGEEVACEILGLLGGGADFVADGV